MSKNKEELNPTTVRLTQKAQEVKDDLAPIFGLKNILSAGLILFGKLTDSQQKKAIAEANSLLTDPAEAARKDEAAAARDTKAAKHKQDRRAVPRAG